MATIISNFKEIVETYPNNIAVSYAGIHISYKQLDVLSDTLATILQKEISPGELVLICMPKSIEFIIAILGILKLRCSYIPVDTNYPKARIEYIINNSKVSTVLTYSDFDYDNLFPKACRIYTFSIDSLSQSTKEYTQFIQKFIKDNSLAYVIYTSGTTGNPKGVMITHKSIMNTLLELIKILQISESSRLMMFAPLGFDASISDIYTALLSGACLCIPNPQDLYSPELISKFVQKQKISVLSLPPSILIQIPYFVSDYLKTIVSVAEACPQKLSDTWSEFYTFINAYGPTEAAVFATIKICKPNNITTIGFPLKNTKAYVLNDKMLSVNHGEVGHLYLSGIGLALGYHNNLQETNKRFINNPFNKNRKGKYSRLYDTGDLAKINTSGELEYIGRADTQVKINGFRIELCEIEYCLLKNTDIKQAVALVHETNDQKQIYVAYTTNDQKPLDRIPLTLVLRKSLPEYMLPEKYIHFSTFSLTPNGKIDKFSIINKIIEIENNYNPLNDIESIIKLFFQKYLSTDDIDVNGNFFDFGIKSLGLARICNEISNKINKKIDILLFYEFPTIKMLANHLEKEFEGAYA